MVSVRGGSQSRPTRPTAPRDSGKMHSSRYNPSTASIVSVPSRVVSDGAAADRARPESGRLGLENKLWKVAPSAERCGYANVVRMIGGWCPPALPPLNDKAKTHACAQSVPWHSRSSETFVCLLACLLASRISLALCVPRYARACATVAVTLRLPASLQDLAALFMCASAIFREDPWSW